MEFFSSLNHITRHVNQQNQRKEMEEKEKENKSSDWSQIETLSTALLRNYKFDTHLNWSDFQFKMENSLKLAHKQMVKIKRHKW